MLIKILLYSFCLSTKLKEGKILKSHRQLSTFLFLLGKIGPLLIITSLFIIPYQKKKKSLFIILLREQTFCYVKLGL